MSSKTISLLEDINNFGNEKRLQMQPHCVKKVKTRKFSWIWRGVRSTPAGVERQSRCRLLTPRKASGKPRRIPNPLLR